VFGYCGGVENAIVVVEDAMECDEEHAGPQVGRGNK
jgi:4-hydroxy-3-methylbut-2-enyl diphosphate reductase IspH